VQSRYRVTIERLHPYQKTHRRVNPGSLGGARARVRILRLACGGTSGTV